MTLAIGIDPRIRARRIAVRRAEGRRRLHFFMVVAGSVALVVSGWAVSRSALFDLDHITIDGAAGSRVAEIESVLGMSRGMPLIEVDLGVVEANLEALPWVETADASRDWPGTLNIDVVERTAVAALPAAGGRVLIDATGVVIGGAPGPPALADLPFIDVTVAVTPGEVEGAALPGLAVVEVMPADLLPWVNKITVATASGADARPVVGLDLIGAAKVNLGDVEHLADKLAAVRAVLGAAELGCVRVIDVTVADLPTITRDPGCDGRPDD